MGAVKALLVSPDPELRDILRVALQGAERQTGDPWEWLEASNGLEGIRMAWRERPAVVVADEIASGAGAFALAKDLKGAQEPFSGVVFVVLARPEDAWLARWSGADRWFERPVDPFALADAVVELVGHEAEPVETEAR